MVIRKIKHADVQAILGRRIFQYIAAISGALGVIATEMHFEWAAPAIPVLTSGNYTFTITNDEGSWLAITVLGGTIVGSFIAGFLTDTIGRKYTLLLATLPLTIAWIIIGFSKSLNALFVARFISGVPEGICLAVVPIYLGEIAEVKVRGMLGTLLPVFVVVGDLIVNSMGFYLPLDKAAFYSAIFPIAQFLMFMWMPESPSYLLLHGREHEAGISLHILRGNSKGAIELERIKGAYGKHQKRTKLIELFTNKVNRRSLFIILGLRTIRQISGFTPILFYIGKIFEESKDFLNPNTSIVLFFAFQITVVTITSFLIDIVGRRPLILTSTIGTTLSLFALSLFLYLANATPVDTTKFNYITAAGLLSFILFFSVGLQILPFLMAGEIFSPEVKAAAVSLSTMYFSVLAASLGKLFQVINDSAGMHFSFLLFGLCTLAGVFWVYFCVPETKGKTLEDIQRELSGQPLKDKDAD